MKLPTLYKRTSTGAIEQWTIRVERSLGPAPYYDIITEHGQVGGKMIESREKIYQGKNLGKKNATTTEQQAELQAKSEWNVKLTRKGYVEELARAQAGENNGAGGIRPMLAKSFDDHGDKLEYPCYAQPKLDGIRCIAVVGEDLCSCQFSMRTPFVPCGNCNNGNVPMVTLWTREQKPILAVPNVARAVAKLGLPAGTVLDGELYNHDLKDDFEQIVSCVRKQYEASPEEQALIQYHVYDLPRHPGLPAKAHFGDRLTLLALNVLDKDPTRTVQLVGTRILRSKDELLDYRRHCQKNGYEGAMARGLAPYEEGKRSAQLLKMKEFLEEDFDIVGVKEGKGKMAGLAIFQCRAANGNLFDVKMEGALDGLRKYLEDESTWQDRKLTVRFFSLTNKNKVPRFPVGKAVRDYE